MAVRDSRIAQLALCVSGVMSTLVIYGLMQEKIMRSAYDAEFFNFPLFIVLCNRLLTCAICLLILALRGGQISPAAPLYKYAGVSVSNVAATTCQYEALKYVSFPVQTLSKSAKMVPVMIWGTAIMQKRYDCYDYLVALCVTLGCTMFFLLGDSTQLPSVAMLRHHSAAGGDDSFWGLVLITGYLGFDGFTSTFQDKLFKGYNMEIYNQILYVTLCSCALSMAGLVSQGHWLPALGFLSRHPDCLLDIALLSAAASTSQFFISYTIRTFGALVFATIMTTRQLISILLSCAFFGHPPTAPQWAGAGLVFGALYLKTYLNSKKKKPLREAAPVVVVVDGLAGVAADDDDKAHLLKVDIDRLNPSIVVEKSTA